MSERGITLARSAQELAFVTGRKQGFRLVIEAQDAVSMPAAVFAHQRRQLDPYSGTAEDEFCFVCSPFDLTKYPADEPNPEQFPQFFRKSSIDIILASQAMAEEAWAVIQREVCGLVDALNRLDVLGVAETTRCGDEVPDSGSEGSGSEPGSEESGSEPGSV